MIDTVAGSVSARLSRAHESARRAIASGLVACLFGLTPALAWSADETTTSPPADASGDPPAGQSPRFEIESDPLFDDLDAEYDDLDEEMEDGQDGFPDPFEETNRPVFGFNGGVDRFVLDPLTKAYNFVFRGVVKRSIKNFFSNLGLPATIFNDVVQLEWKDAGISTGRLVVNSTVGIAGFFDPATHIALSHHRSDFGQTLALAGTPSGPYLVIPVIGPTTTRDGFGALADTTMDPLTWFIGPANFLIYGLYTSSQGISTRAEHAEQLTALREGSIDYYASMRNAFYQNRVDQIWGRRPHRRGDWDELD